MGDWGSKTQQWMARSAAGYAKSKMQAAPEGSKAASNAAKHFNDFKRINRKVSKDLRRGGR